MEIVLLKMLTQCSDTSDCQSDSDNEQEGEEALSVSDRVGAVVLSTSTNGTNASASPSTAHDHPLAPLQEKLKELTTAYDLVVKNSHQLSKFVSDLESGASKATAAKPKENLALMKITSAAMVKVSSWLEASQSVQPWPLIQLC